MSSIPTHRGRVRVDPSDDDVSVSMYLVDDVEDESVSADLSPVAASELARQLLIFAAPDYPRPKALYATDNAITCNRCGEPISLPRRFDVHDLLLAVMDHNQRECRER